MDELLKYFGFDLSYDQLKPAEREVFHRWVDDLKKDPPTVGKVKQYVHQLRDAVEKELTNTSITAKQDVFLKARLANYMLIDAFLTSPAMAEKALKGA